MSGRATGPAASQDLDGPALAWTGETTLDRRRGCRRDGRAHRRPGSAGAPARADDPSWDEVQAAKSNAAAAQTQVDRINGLLAQLQTAAAAAGDLAVKRAAAFGAAQTALATATEKATGLAQQADRAKQEAEELKAQSGRLAAQLTRSGASDVSLRLFLSGSTASSDGLLYQLGAVSKLADRSSSLFSRATAQKNLAASLSDQAAAAQKERDRLAQEAQQASAQADAAKEAADASVAEQRTRADTLYAQLATLKNTEASVERAYAQGEALRKAREEAARLAREEQERQQQQQQQQQQEQEEAANAAAAPTAPPLHRPASSSTRPELRPMPRAASARTAGAATRWAASSGCGPRSRAGAPTRTTPPAAPMASRRRCRAARWRPREPTGAPMRPPRDRGGSPTSPAGTVRRALPCRGTGHNWY
ncbi:hypothetical protein P5G50_10210 [Leifsonia sp. F6_8S_P_1B]|uniref:Uncharacterized protein n=1 Tax=Leifsonia williamsii TaxID=3035919 RepID=A0ABT8KCU4_9MICO|nr:hypothetical protein [Leifsonia williamsii]MDN4614827.1 hypothetical protein [Leifsonia williamsii]